MCPARRFLNDDQFRMGRGVLPGLSVIVRFRDHDAVSHQQGGNRHFADQRR
jgi:hypothetical protein